MAASSDGTVLTYIRADDVEADGFNVFRKILGKEREIFLIELPANQSRMLNILYRKINRDV